MNSPLEIDQDVGVLISVLGPATIDGKPIRSRRQARLLAALALDLGTTISNDRLIEQVWGPEFPADPLAALHTIASRLRRALPDGVVLASAHGSYRLEAAPGTVDLHSIAEWRRDRIVDEPNARLQRATLALELFRGVPFDELDDVDAVTAREHLLELKRQIAETRAESLLALGRAGEAADALRSVIAEEPTRESAVARFMEACYATGRQPEALAAADALRATLRDEFGLDPTPRIVMIERAILDHSLDVDINGRARSAQRASQLPARGRTSFVGRDDDLTQLGELARSTRMLTILGSGGVGKTRLVLELAHILSETDLTVVFVDLSHVPRAESINAAVSDALGIPLGAASDRIEALVQHLGLGRVVIILDNCEHVISGVHAFAETALQRSVALSIVATSREPTNVEGEHRWLLRGLTTKAAERLFRERAKAADPSGIRAQDGDVVDGLCARLNGVPLSIELAAAALATVGLREIFEGLDRPLETLHDTRRAIAARHRDLRSVIDWSYRLLDDVDRDAFSRTAVFPGSFTATDVASVCGDAVAERLGSLVERSLITRHIDLHPTRYELLESIRAYARERRGASLSDDLRAHSAWTFALVRDSEPHLIGPEEVDHFRLLRSNMANLRQAYEQLREYGSPDDRGAFVRTLAIWGWQCDEGEVLRWALETSTTFGDSASPGALNAAAAAVVAMSRGGDLEAAGGRAANLLEHARNASPEIRAFANYAAAEVALFRGSFEDAATYAERAANDGLVHGPSGLAFFGAVDAAFANAYRRNQTEHAAWVERASTLAETLDSALARAWVELCRADGLQDDAPDQARLHFERCLGLCDGETSSFLIWMAETSRANMIVRAAATTRELPAYAAVLEHWIDARAWTFVLSVLRRLVADLARLGLAEEAATLLGVVTAAGPIADEDAARLAEARSNIDRALGVDAAREAVATGARLRIADAAVRAIAFVRSCSAPPNR